MVAKKSSTEVAVPGTNVSSEELANVKTFGEALQLVRQMIGEENVVVASEELGDGFKLLENKDQLIGVQMLIITWSFHQGDHGEFVSAKIMTADNGKFIVNDGSTGIYTQLAEFSKKKNQQGGLWCNKGLRRSDYKFTDDKGEEKNATTYYLDTSA